MNFFSKSPKKTSPKKASPADFQPPRSPSTSELNDDDTPHSPLAAHANPPLPSRARSPARRARTAKKPVSKDAAAGSQSRSGRVSPRQRHLYDTTSHPLNLPPDQLRRLSALSNLSTQPSMSEPMDVEPGSRAKSPSPVKESSQPPAGYFESKANGTSNVTSTPSNNNNNNNNNPPKTNPGPEIPVPPPHKSAPISPGSAVPHTPEEAEIFKTAGNKFYNAKEYRKAIEEYTRAVDAQPTSATYLSNRAAAYIGAGDYLSALEDCLHADELDPRNAKILLRLARTYVNLGRPQEALDTFGRIQPPPSAKDLAPARAMLQHIQQAQEALEFGTTGSMALHGLDQAEKLLGLGAARPRKWQLMRGDAYLKMGTVNALGDAQNVAMSLLRNNNQDPEALVLRGRALYCQGENTKAIQHFRQALSCDPDYKDAIKYLRMVQKLDRTKAEGNADYKAGRFEAAVEKYTEALEIDPLNKGINSKLYQNRAVALQRLKDYTGSIRDCEKALSLDPSYTKARRTKATTLGLVGNWAESVREWKDLQEADPSDASIAKEVRKAELELKKSKRKDYYKILGLEKDADENAIKKAYRKAAIIHHPDKNPDDEQAAERFKDIAESYETLSDPQKRARYDSGEDLVDPMDAFGGGGMGGGGMAMDPEILMQMFSAQMGGGGRGGPPPGFSFGGGMPGGMPGGGRSRGAPQGFPGGFNFQ